MADNEMIINAPVTDVAAGEDFIIINQEKDIKQVALVQLMSKVIDLIPIESNEFPKALNLDVLLKEITYRLFHLSTSDIGYDGDINMEYGNLKNVLIFILDKINSYENGLASKDIVYEINADTPNHVMSLESKSIEDMINYILNNYRYGNTPIIGEDISIDISSWDGGDYPDNTINATTNLQKAFDTVYDIIANKTDKTKKIYASNTDAIELFNGVTEDIATIGISINSDTMLEITGCVSITCNVPGVFSTIVYKNGSVIDSFEDALTTGNHTINTMTYTDLKNDSDSSATYSVSIKGIFIPDENTGDILIPASIDIGKCRLLYQGYNISYKDISEGVI